MAVSWDVPFPDIGSMSPMMPDPFREVPATWPMSRRLLAASASALYVYLVITGHDVAQAPALHVESQIGTDAWNRIAAVGALLAAAVLAFFWLRRVWNVAPRRPALLWVAAGLTLAIACHELLMIKTVEIVHFVQYGLLTWMLVPVARGTGEAALLSFLAGVADELYQYLWLHRGWQPYLDLNDIVMNLVGCLLAAALWTAASRHGPPRTSRLRRPQFLIVSATVAVLSVLFATGVVGLYRDTGHVPLQQWNRPVAPEPYVAWSQESGRTYHRLLPWEAFLLLGALGAALLTWPIDE